MSVAANGRFGGRGVVVTGAGSGFGEAIARRFAAEGARVCISDINGGALDRVAAEIESAGWRSARARTGTGT
jgi:3-oxoacyl-[acyl-carrier protein] reductase